MSLIILTMINGTLSLIRSYNPVTILGSGGVKATASLADAIDGDQASDGRSRTPEGPSGPDMASTSPV